MRPWWALVALCLGFFVTLADTTAVPVAMPVLMTTFEVPISTAIWVSSAYLVSFATLLLVSGRLGDRYGQRRIFMLGVTTFTAAAIASGLTTSLPLLIAARTGQGIGAALLVPQTMALINLMFPAERRGTPMGVWGTIASLAALTGPVVGGLLVATLGWQAVFLAEAPIGLVSLLLAWRFLPRTVTGREPFDLVGTVLALVGSFLVVWGLLTGRSQQWDVGVVATIAAGVVTLGAFIAWQVVRGPRALMPLALFAERDFAVSTASVTLVSFSMTAMAFAVMFYAQDVLGLLPDRAGLLMLPMAVMSASLAPLAGHLTDRVGPRVLASSGMFLFGAGLVWAAYRMDPELGAVHLVAPMLVLGIAMAFIYAPLATAANRRLPSVVAGAGSGAYNGIRQFGSVLGSVAVALLLQSQWDLPVVVRDTAAEASQHALLVTAGVITVGGLMALLLRSRNASVREDSVAAVPSRPT